MVQHLVRILTRILAREQLMVPSAVETQSDSLLRHEVSARLSIPTRSILKKPSQVKPLELDDQLGQPEEGESVSRTLSFADEIGGTLVHVKQVERIHYPDDCCGWFCYHWREALVSSLQPRADRWC